MSVAGGSSSGAGGDDKVKMLIDSFLEQLPAEFSMMDIQGKTKERTPYIVVSLQECERMNILTSEIKRTLWELDQGLKGALNITDAMDDLAAALNQNRVPPGWEKYAYFSKKSLIEWFADLLLRIEQLQGWTEDMIAPPVVWISGLFNPMSYITAIMQVTARANNLPLDDMVLQTDVLNTKNKADLPEFAEAGAYINGFFLEGAGWEMGRGADQGYLTDMVLKDLHPDLPVMHVKAISRKDKSMVGMYPCPVYVTTMRGPTYVFTADLKMESDDSDPNKWILGGVALMMNPE